MGSLKSMGILYYIAAKILNSALIDRVKSNDRVDSDK